MFHLLHLESSEAFWEIPLIPKRPCLSARSLLPRSLVESALVLLCTGGFPCLARLHYGLPASLLWGDLSIFDFLSTALNYPFPWMILTSAGSWSLQDGSAHCLAVVHLAERFSGSFPDGKFFTESNAFCRLGLCDRMCCSFQITRYGGGVLPLWRLHWFLVCVANAKHVSSWSYVSMLSSRSIFGDYFLEIPPCLSALEFCHDASGGIIRSLIPCSWRNSKNWSVPNSVAESRHSRPGAPAHAIQPEVKAFWAASEFRHGAQTAVWNVVPWSTKW